MTSLKGKLFAGIAGVYIITCCHAFGITRSSVASGNWSNASLWSPAGVPASTDNVIIISGNTVTVDANANSQELTINTGGLLTFLAGKKLTINGTFTVNGTVIMNGGDIAFTVPNAPFILGDNSSFTWDPGTNDAANATLFVNGNESFAPSSTLIINKWYNYTSLPLGNVVSGNFGNLIINTRISGTILEWNQNNQFQTHMILGTLTIDQGWLTLDKSGTITNTTIGNIVLKNANSYFTAYNGTAFQDFTLTTSSITNNGGTFFGIFDGNGNITLNVTGDFTNSGNVKLIDNNGQMGAGLCNGNAALSVGGAFSQSSGDTRFIYNLYSTISGIYTASIGVLNIAGGVFMGQYAVHSGSLTSTFHVANDCKINLPDAKNIFRCNGLTNMSSNVSNLKLNFRIGGNLFISGNTVAEFTSNASSGNETDSIMGNFQIDDGITSFNYGSILAGHNTVLVIAGDMTVNGGVNYLSRMGGTLSSVIYGNLSLTGGSLILKGDNGTGLLTVNGSFNQSGGKFYNHSNYSTPTSDAVNAIINGDFNQSSGIINFDDCSSSAASHSLVINGINYNLSGAATITRTGNTNYGNIYFGRQGTTQFNRANSLHSIQQVKQYISHGCTLNVHSGNVQVASGDGTGDYFFEILNGGTADMNGSQFISNAVAAHSAIKADSGGTLRTACPNGLYDGTSASCINPTFSNLEYYLDPNSTVEYNGNGNQVVTGIQTNNPASLNQKYGILRINFKGTEGGCGIFPTSPNVFVRSRLELINGGFNLNGHELTIESGSRDAITRMKGYIISETNTPYNPSVITWKHVSGGAHEFPFAVNASAYIPVIFTPVAGMGGDVTFSTRATATSDNKPLPDGISQNLAISRMDSSYTMSRVIDRWWNITANGFTANVTLSYCGTENTMDAYAATSRLQVNQWNGSNWNQGALSYAGVTSGVGTVTISNANLFSTWMVSGQPERHGSNAPTDSIMAGTDEFDIHSLGPNPFSSGFSVTYTLYHDGPVKIQMTDRAGKTVHAETVQGAAGINNYVFTDKYHLSEGLYIIYMSYNDTKITRKLVKN